VAFYGLFLAWLCLRHSPALFSRYDKTRIADISSDQLSPESLQKIITSANKSCDAVTLTFNQGTNVETGESFWNIACRDGHEYSISIGRGGTTHVVACDAMRLSGVECFKTFEEQKKQKK
jgi:hypothetical protein